MLYGFNADDGVGLSFIYTNIHIQTNYRFLCLFRRIASLQHWSFIKKNETYIWKSCM